MPAGNQIVFLIHRTIAKRQESDHEVWKKDLHNAACKLLLHFESLDYKALNWKIKVGSVENENDQFKWGYKFAKKAGIQFHNLCDFKKLNSENVKLFEQELNYDDEEEEIEYSAHTLVENLITLAHDFHWEHLEIMSPVKPLRKRKSRDMDSRKRRSNGKTNIAEITASGNYVFIVGPVPKSKDDLKDYFGWEVDTLAEVTRILMPAHLSHHFREKHNIRLFWLDTNSKTPELFEKKGRAGFSVIEEFLKSNSGCVIPISYLNDIVASEVKSSLGFSGTNCLRDQDNIAPLQSGKLRRIFSTSTKLNHLCTIVKPFQPIEFQASFIFPSCGPTVSATCTVVCTTLQIKNTAVQKRHSALQNTTDVVQNDFISFGISQSNKLFCLKAHSEVDQGYYSATVNQEACQFSVIGQFPVSIFPLDSLSGFGVMCIFNDSEFQSNTKEVTTAYAVVEKCQSCCGDTTLKQKCSIFHRYGLLQVISRKCATVSWISETHLVEVADLIKKHSLNLDNNSQEINNFVQSCCEETQLLEPVQTNGEIDNPQVPQEITLETDEQQFTPNMLETWFDRSNKSDKFTQFTTQLSSQHKPPSSMPSEEAEFHSSILSAMQEAYNSNTAIDQGSLKADITAVKSCNSITDVSDAMLFEYKLSLEKLADANQCRQDAHSIMQLLCKYCDKEGIPRDDSQLQGLLTTIFLSATDIRKKDVESHHKIAECKMQLLLRLEWLSHKHTKSKADTEYDESRFVEEVVQLLRTISIADGVENMAAFLQETIVENYAERCGGLLHEVHNDLMLRMPQVLEQYSMDGSVDESFYAPLSNIASIKAPSTGPFSAQSSVNSQCSNDSRINRRNFRSRRASHINQITTRQIVMPHQSKDAKWARTKSVESIRATLASNANKTNNRKMEEPPKESSAMQDIDKGVSQEVVRVRRDLFASPSKSARKKLNNLTQAKNGKATKGVVRKVVEERRLRRTSVIDTPIAKQKFTALARQRMRSRRSCGTPDVGPDHTIVEESPMKEEETQRILPHAAAKLRRSPRHAIMLTRRHSFYRDDVGGKSRTVARAEVVQQHHEAAPPTPSAARSKQLSDAGSKTPFSPGSLLFKYTGPGQRNIGRKYATENPQRTRRRLNLVSTPLSDTFKPVAKNLFSSNPEDQNTEISLATSAPQPSVKAPQKSTDFDGKAPQPTTPPGIPTPFAAYQDSDGLTNVFVSPDRLTTHATHKPPNISQQKSSQNFTTPQKPDPNFTTPQKPHPIFTTPQKSYLSHTPPQKQPVTLATPKKRRDTIPAAQRPVLSTEATTSKPGIMTSPNRKTSPRRSPRIQQMGNISPAPTKLTGPIDTFVTRTPSSCKKPPHVRPPPPPPSLLKRKPSPIGDHIQKWPRKKRLNSSPNLPSKRIRKDSLVKLENLFDELDATPDLIPFVHEPTKPGVDEPYNTQLDSPDLGVYIVSGSDQQQRISRVPPTTFTSDTSPGVDVADLIARDFSPGKRMPTRNTPNKFSDFLPNFEDIGVRPFGELPILNRRISPRRRLGSTLLHAKIGSPTSTKHIPLMLLHDNVDST